ncbi:MAG TPA: hypothetical protein PKM13_04165, partial [Candidatus Bipolaricaulis anaerobius]|nr:hypothetical protein [Candidatus Bipolaricaulis anaerobius]
MGERGAAAPLPTERRGREADEVPCAHPWLVHDLRHDGLLYRSRKAFARDAQRINRHLCEWGAVGFRSGFM